MLEDGHLILDKAAGASGVVSVPGPLAIREGRVTLNSQDNLADTSVVTVETGGTLDLNGHDDTIAALVLNGGGVETDAGVLTLTGAVTAQGFGGSISGQLSLGSTTRTFEVGPMATLTVSAVMGNGGGLSHPGLAKTGPGTLRLLGANTFTGAVNVYDGIVEVGHASALGSSSCPATASRQMARGSSRVEIKPGVGEGILTFAGQTINTFQGRALVHEGRVHCAKPDGYTALSGGLEIDGLNTGGAPIVRLYADQQINDEGEFVYLARGGILDLNGHTEDIRSLLGVGASSEIRIGSGELRVFKGSYAGLVSGTGRLRKISADRLALFGDNTYTGDTLVEEGTLSVYRTLASGKVLCQPNTELSGDGTMQHAVLNQASLKPGLSTAFQMAAMTFEHLTLTNTAVYTAEIRGVVPGDGYDQLQVNGTVRLDQAALDLRLGHPGAANTAYILINNAGNEPVQGTFAEKPEGATFSIAGAQFQITYQGGDGNDVVALQLTPATNDFTVRLDVAPVPGTNQVVVSWPTFASDHRLHRCTDLKSNSWHQVFGNLLISNDKFHQTFQTTNEALLFRLEKPQN